VIPDTIVVPLDGSELAERAVPVASRLARRIGARLLLMTAPSDDDRREPGAYLDAVAALAVDVPVDTVVVPDRGAADAIDDVADAVPGRMVCMTTHGRGRFRWAMAGSVAEAVVRSATKPLLLIGPRTLRTWTGDPGQVVVGVDGSSASRKAAVAACEWAKALGSELTLTYVARPLDIGDALHPDEFVTPLEQLVRDQGIPLHTRIERGSYVAGALLDVAEEPPATMLVMAAHSRTGVARLVLGSVTMGVLNGSACPVLVTPPGADEAPVG
jgi:nucleotide-binding universal stress UspA family protein